MLLFGFFWSRGKNYNPSSIFCFVYLMNIHYFACNNFSTKKNVLVNVANPFVLFSQIWWIWDGMCFSGNIFSCFHSLFLFLVCMTSASSSLAHSLHVSQMKQELSIVVCCWDGQDISLLSHPWVLFLSCWLQWAVAPYCRRLFIYELMSCSGVSDLIYEGENRSAMWFIHLSWQLKSTLNWGVLRSYWFYAQ